ncbi:MAG: rhodanese-like domain-containing protein [Elusimicrobia bacterium]|nr:rhodanese-like domain-containing protein [Elusimicrobiota bacterium]
MKATMARKFKVINRKELKEKLDRGEKFHLWNVLNKDSFIPSRNIPGSRWVPLEDLESKVCSLNVGADDEIVVYCSGHKCPASKSAADKLASMGYTEVSVYEGGLEDWSAGGLPYIRF